MEPRRTDLDAVHRESRQKLDAARFMKDECAYTGKSLEKYLHGHLFKFQRNRINRHLKSCALCKSGFDALKRTEETRQILKYIDLPEGVAHQVKEGVSALAKLRRILYRPLWLAGIVVVAVALYHYATRPRQIDLELESLVKSAPVSTAAVPAAEPKTVPGMATTAVTAAMTTSAAVAQAPAAQPVDAPAVEPLAVSITPVNETAAVRRINEAMRGFEQMRKLKFSNTERELSGKLTAKRLLAFFTRIEKAATVHYNHKRLESFPEAQPVPFVLTLKAAPKTVKTQVKAQPLTRSTATVASTGATVSAPTPSPPRPPDSKTAVPRR